MKRRLILISAAVISVLFIIIYFVGKTPLDEHPSLKIGVLKHESSLPIYVADELKFFEKRGLHVELTELPPGDHMPALLSARVDIISPTSFTVLFGLMLQHPEALYAVFPDAEVLDGPTVYGLLVRSNFAGQKLDDLSGGVIMAINPYTQVNMRTILSASGITQTQWPVIRIASRESALQAVSDGTAQAAIMDQPAVAIALASGEFRLLEANPRARYIGSPYWSGAGAVLQTRWSQRAADFTIVMEAVDDALAHIRTDPAMAQRILARRLGLSEDIAIHMGGYYSPTSHEAVPLDGIKATVDALVQASLLPAPVDLGHFFPPGLYGHGSIRNSY